MTIIRGSSGEAGRAEVALARILPEGGRSCTDGWSPRSPGRPGWEDAFSGPVPAAAAVAAAAASSIAAGLPGAPGRGSAGTPRGQGAPAQGGQPLTQHDAPLPSALGGNRPGPRPSPAPPPPQQPSPRGALAADRSRGPRRGERARAAGNTDRLRGSARPPPLQLPLPPPQGPGAAEAQSGQNGAPDCVDGETEAQGKHPPPPRAWANCCQNPGQRCTCLTGWNQDFSSG